MPSGRVLQFCRRPERFAEQVLFVVGQGIWVDIVSRLLALVNHGDFMSKTQEGKGFQRRLEVLGCFLVEYFKLNQDVETLNRGCRVDALFEEEHPDTVNDEDRPGLLDREFALVLIIFFENKFLERADRWLVLEVIFQKIVKNRRIAANFPVDDVAQIIT